MQRTEKQMSVAMDCPMPAPDHDLITLGHGSGGLLTHTLLTSGVFDLFRNEMLDRHHDGAIFHANGALAFTTDSFVVSPIFFPGGNIGELAIYGTVNDLAMCGAVPQYLSLSFIIEEGLPMRDFREVLLAIRRAADRCGVKIITGDTKVVEKGKGDKLFINTTGIGQVHARAQIDMARVMPGDKVIISGPLARHGIAIMSVREGLTFEADVVSDTTHLNEPVIALLDRFGGDIHMLRDATRGGLATVLAEIAGTTTLGIDISESALTIDEQVSAACELLGLDPLYVANEGVFVCIASANVADACIEVLRQHACTMEAGIIGEVTDDHHGKVVCESAVGGRRVLNLLAGEQLPRIC